ncbi:hypothetical protein SOVF_208340 [Spinacia oleracea]|nr:hypothetical protein SOVF_208340 [Spinacia oleracea]
MVQQNNCWVPITPETPEKPRSSIVNFSYGTSTTRYEPGRNLPCTEFLAGPANGASVIEESMENLVGWANGASVIGASTENLAGWANDPTVIGASSENLAGWANFASVIGVTTESLVDLVNGASAIGASMADNFTGWANGGASVIGASTENLAGWANGGGSVIGASTENLAGWANGGGSVIGANQFEFQSDPSASIAQEPLLREEKKSKNKRQKVAMDLNKKPGEKRKFKYFWPKIDDSRAQTPKPKTPKQVTPKVKTPKQVTPKPKTPKTPKTPKPKTPKPVKKKVTKKDFDVSEILESILPETEEANISEILENVLPEASSCKRALNFKDISFVEDGGVKVVEKQSFNDLSCNGGNQNEKSEKDKSQRTLKVYRRRNNSKCLNECRKIGNNFLDRCKKKRKGRSNLITKGSRMMLLPMQLKIDRDSFDCIFSLLFSRMKFRKRKRSAKKLAPVSDVVKQPGDLHTISCCSPPDHINIPHLHKTSFERDEVLVNLDQGEIGSDRSLRLAICSVLQSKESETNSPCSTSESEKSKTKLAKEKPPKGPTKRQEKKKIRQEKKKIKSCLKKLKAWNGKSMEQIIDPLVEYFESLSFYEDLDSIERLSIMVKGENNLALVAQQPNKEADGTEKPFEETEEFCEEREILQAKMNRFYMVMTNLQGPKDFVKWNGSVLDSVVGVFLTQNVSDVLSSNAYMEVASRYPIKPQTNEDEDCGIDSDISSSQGSTGSTSCSTNGPIIEYPEEEVEEKEETKAREKEYDTALKDMIASLPNLPGPGKEKKGEDAEKFDWEPVRLYFLGKSTERSPDTQDSVDWEAVRKAPVKDIAKAIEQRGQHRIIAGKIQRTLNRLVDKHGTMDLEWLRQAPFEVAKAYLLSFYGLGMKSVECLRLLTLGHDAFPVDVNISRIAVRLGWIPLGTLPKDTPFHLLEKYPLEDAIQEYLWSRICNMERKKLYSFNLYLNVITYQIIDFINLMQ